MKTPPNYFRWSRENLIYEIERRDADSAALLSRTEQAEAERDKARTHLNSEYHARKAAESSLKERGDEIARLREKLTELDERIQTALACQEQDVKVNGARHPGLLEPMRGILQDIAAQSRALLSHQGGKAS
jgi:predicted nuclease with TOPRIM domain